MVKPGHRSHSQKRVFVTTPGGTSKVQYRKRQPSKAKCGNCGAVLKGTASDRPYKMQNMAKTKKRPDRPFGGVLCSKCMRSHIIQKARENV